MSFSKTTSIYKEVIGDVTLITVTHNPPPAPAPAPATHMHTHIENLYASYYAYHTERRKNMDLVLMT